MSDSIPFAAPVVADVSSTRVSTAASSAAAAFATPATPALDVALLRRAYGLMQTAAAMTDLYEDQKAVASRYVHATARGHEAIQLAAAFLLKETDYAAPYYRDDALLLGLGLRPFELMLQLLAKRDDPFSGGAHLLWPPQPATEGVSGHSAPKLGHRNAGDSGYGDGAGGEVFGRV